MTVGFMLGQAWMWRDIVTDCNNIGQHWVMWGNEAGYYCGYEPAPEYDEDAGEPSVEPKDSDMIPYFPHYGEYEI